jgi:hypothetical protein
LKPLEMAARAYDTEDFKKEIPRVDDMPDFFKGFYITVTAYVSSSILS